MQEEAFYATFSKLTDEGFLKIVAIHFQSSKEDEDGMSEKALKNIKGDTTDFTALK